MEKTYFFLANVLMFLFSVILFISTQWQSGMKEADVRITPSPTTQVYTHTNTQLVLLPHIQVLAPACYPSVALYTLASRVPKKCSYLLPDSHMASFMLSLFWA